jgi:enoyl-[acyl-carrier protein] reductase II
MSIRNRVTELLGVEHPIVQAPMGWIARAQLASAVSNAGAMGIIETSSGRLDEVRGEILKMRDLTDKPFGVNIALAFVRDPDIVQFVIDQGVRFVSTSAGDPSKVVPQLKAAGLTVFHVVPTLKAALKAVDAGVDGLIVEGAEGGGFKNQRDVATMVLLPLVCSKVAVPVIAGVQMGTRMLAAAESPVHPNWKEAIVRAEETDTVFLNRGGNGPAMRALRTQRTSRLEFHNPENIRNEMAGVLQLYFDGDMEAAVPLTGQVCGRIDSVKPVREIVEETVRGFHETIARLSERYR